MSKSDLSVIHRTVITSNAISPSHTPCRRGLGTGSSPTAEGWDWRGLGTGVPSKCVGLGTESRLAGWDWVGLGTEVLSESSEKLSSRLKLA